MDDDLDQWLSKANEDILSVLDSRITDADVEENLHRVKRAAALHKESYQPAEVGGPVVIKLTEEERRLNVEARILAVVSSYGGKPIVAGPVMSEMVQQLMDVADTLARDGLLPPPDDPPLATVLGGVWDRLVEYDKKVTGSGE